MVHTTTLSGWKSLQLGGRRVVLEKAVMDDRSHDAPEKRAYPIDSVVDPVMDGEGRPEGAGRVHGGAGERLCEEHVDGDGEADHEPSPVAEGTRNFTCGRKKNEDDEKGHQAFEQHTVHAGEVRREVGRAECDGTP